MGTSWLLGQCLFYLIGIPLVAASIDAQLPIYNPVTRCHDLPVPDDSLSFALCLQRGSDKQHPYNLHTAPSFCSSTYSPHGHLIELSELSSDLIDFLLQSLTKLLSTKTARIDRPEPNFLWISANWTENSFKKEFWCPQSCRSKNNTEKNLILKTRCQFDNQSQPCLTTRHTHWDRAPFICLFNQTTALEKKSVLPAPAPPATPPPVVPVYSNDTIIFHDANSCLVARSRTHQYTFCFRRQACSLSQTSAFCTTRGLAHDTCEREKNHSQLLTIENDDEYRLINEIVSLYSNETLLNIHGRLTNKYIVRAQWMWIGGIRNINDMYQWNIGNQSFVSIADHLWCGRMSNCSGGQGRDHVVLNIVCQSKSKSHQVCLASRRASEPGPFICKRVLTNHEEPVSNYTYLHSPVKATNTRTVPTAIAPTYEKNSTAIYYDEHHCLTAQSLTHLYTFCFRRQTCSPRKAYCTKWSQAQQECQSLKDNARLLTIENEQERALITDVVDDYRYETRLTYNGSSYRYFVLAHYLWIDGIQKDNYTYRWKDDREVIPKHLWCPEDGCDSMGRDRVTLNMLCKKNQTAVCLGTSIQWKLAPYACKRPRPRDHCPILFDKIRSIHSSEMLVVTVNRTIALIKCKHPDYNTEVRVQYQCEISTSRWILTYENSNYTCPNYEVPPMALSINVSQSVSRTTISTSTQPLSSSTSAPANACSSAEYSSIIARLPTQSRYIAGQNLPSLSSSYYDRRFICYFNHSIQITYRCDLSEQRWIYVHGASKDFRRCYPPCSYEERNELLDKYFTYNERSKIRINRRRHQTTLRLRCFNDGENRWNSIIYSCGSLSLTKEQWFKLHACFDSRAVPTLPSVTVSMVVTERPLLCPPPIARGSPCEYQSGQFITDSNGCSRKVCPQLSQLCRTIRCPPDRVCRVIPCTSCLSTDYLQAVCEYSYQPSLCDLESQLLSYNDESSIAHWEQKTIALVRQYARERRQRLTSPWPILTIN